MLGSLILYLKGMRIMMFQLSGFYYKSYIQKSCPLSSKANSSSMSSEPAKSTQGKRSPTLG